MHALGRTGVAPASEVRWGQRSDATSAASRMMFGSRRVQCGVAPYRSRGPQTRAGGGDPRGAPFQPCGRSLGERAERPGATSYVRTSNLILLAHATRSSTAGAASTSIATASAMFEQHAGTVVLTPGSSTRIVSPQATFSSSSCPPSMRRQLTLAVALLLSAGWAKADERLIGWLGETHNTEGTCIPSYCHCRPLHACTDHPHTPL